MSSNPARRPGKPRDGEAADGWVGQEEANARMGDVIFATVPAAQRDVVSPEDYRYEKVIGRRTAGGHVPLKRLNVRHKNIIALHLRGLSNRDISSVTGMAESSVSAILRDPLSQECITSYLEGIDAELMALAPLAVNAVRDGLTSGEARTRLLAADRFFKATGKYANAERKQESAEDVLTRALARVAAERDVKLRELDRKPTVHLDRPSSRGGLLIDGTAEDVSDG